MDKISFRRVHLNQLKMLRDLSILTYTEAFEHQNNPADFEKYISTAFSEKRLSEELLNRESRFFFILANEEIAGYLKLNTGSAQTESKLPDALEIERVYVQKDFQRKGIGKTALIFASDMARKTGFTWIWLGVWEKNERARKLYEEDGFEPFGSHIFMMGDDAQTDILMRKKISDA